MVIGAIMRGLESLERTAVGRDERMVNGTGDAEGVKDKLIEKVGEVTAERIVGSGRAKLVSAVLENDVSL